MKACYILILLSINCFIAQATEWEKVDLPKSEYVECFYEKDNDVIIGSIGLRLSLDGGQTFKYSNTLKDYNSNGEDWQNNMFGIDNVYITEEGIFIAVPYNENIMYSSDKGETWYGNNSELSVKDTKFFETQEGIFLAHSEGILFSADGGKDWTEIYISDNKAYNSQTYFDISDDNKIYFILTNSEIDCYEITVCDCKTKKIVSDTIQIDYANFFVFGNDLYAFDKHDYHMKDTLWKSSDYGQSWEMERSLTKQILNQINFSGDYVSHNLMIANDGIITAQIETTDPNKEYLLAISTDNGISWNTVKNDTFSLHYYYYHYKIDRGEFYFNYRFWYKYDKETQTMIKQDFDFPNTKTYKNFKDRQIAVMQTRRSWDFWVKEGESWEYQYGMKNLKDNIYSWSGELFYKVDGNLLRAYKSENTIVLKDNIWDFKIIREYDDGSSLMMVNDYDNSTSRKVYLLKDGKIKIEFQYVEKMFDYDLESNTFYTFDTGPHYISPLYVGTPEKGIIDSIVLPVEGTYNAVSQYSQQKEKIIYSIHDVTYISTDGGKNFETYGSGYSNALVRGNFFYYSSRYGLFRSTNGKTWENLTENEFNGNLTVNKYEFDLDGYIYIYTPMGVYKSAEPVSVAQDEGNSNTPNISINIYPNPSSDILNFDFNGQVDKSAVVDLNGNVISCPQTLNALDISEVSSGAYFLKVTSNGKTFYRQFVKVE